VDHQVRPMPFRLDLDKLSPDVALRIRRENNRAYRMAMSGWLTIAVLLIVSGISFLIDPSQAERSAVNKNLDGAWDELWNCAWILAGSLIFYGIMRPRRYVEMCGQVVLAFSLIPYLVAIIAENGWFGLPGFFLGAAVMLAAISRYLYLYRYAIKFEQREDKWHLI
jgi:hypothetical protein